MVIGENNAFFQLCPVFRLIPSSMRFHMTRFRFPGLAARSCGRERQRLFLCLLTGSLIGALYARACGTLPASGLRFPVRGETLLFSWLRCSLFPCLLLGALCLRRPTLFCGLFFLKGVFVSAAVCVLASSGVETPVLMLRLMSETVLPLPLCFYVGSVWLRQTKLLSPCPWLLIPLLGISFLGVLLETVLLNLI